MLNVNILFICTFFFLILLSYTIIYSYSTTNNCINLNKDNNAIFVDDKLNFHHSYVINGPIYRTKKCQLTSIIRDKKNISILFDASLRTHNIVIHTYQFLRLWLLFKYNNNIDIPNITTDTIQLAFNALTKCGQQGTKPTGEKLKLLNEFNTLYENEYKKLNYEEKIDASRTNIR